MILALAGGVGAARMLSGLIDVVDAASVAAVVNTGDDTVMHGLHVSPDLDTVTYTLAGAINPETGWGLAGETWQAMEHMRRYDGGRLSWFNLGDRDLATHMFRTARLREGATLSQVTAEIADRWEVRVRLLPMSDQPVATRVTADLPGGTAPEEISFQEYFVKHHHGVPVRSLRLEGVDSAVAAPGVLDCVADADTVIICPSNPLVSIGPVLATGGIGEAVQARRDRTVAVSPIIGGRALKGPADRMMHELGREASVVGVARMWAPYASVLVMDEVDRDLARQVEAAGMRPVVGPTVMTGRREGAELARLVLDSVGAR